MADGRYHLEVNVDLRKGDYILFRDFKNLEEFLEVIKGMEERVKRFKRDWWGSTFTHLFWNGNEWWVSGGDHYSKQSGCRRDPKELLEQTGFKLQDKDCFRAEDFISEEQFEAVKALGKIGKEPNPYGKWKQRGDWGYLIYREDSEYPWDWAPLSLSKGRLLTPQQVLGENNVTQPHPHAENMAKYAEDAKKTDKPWLLWETLFDKLTGWVPLEGHPGWNPKWGFRRISERPQEITLAGVTFPRPVKTPLRKGQLYCIPNLERMDIVKQYVWQNLSTDFDCLTKGLVQLNSGAARKQAKAILAALKEVLNEY